VYIELLAVLTNERTRNADRQLASRIQITLTDTAHIWHVPC